MIEMHYDNPRMEEGELININQTEKIMTIMCILTDDVVNNHYNIAQVMILSLQVLLIARE